jgi:hypothetical protein
MFLLNQRDKPWTNNGSVVRRVVSQDTIFETAQFLRFCSAYRLAISGSAVPTVGSASREMVVPGLVIYRSSMVNLWLIYG